MRKIWLEGSGIQEPYNGPRAIQELPLTRPRAASAKGVRSALRLQVYWHEEGINSDAARYIWISGLLPASALSPTPCAFVRTNDMVTWETQTQHGYGCTGFSSLRFEHVQSHRERDSLFTVFHLTSFIVSSWNLLCFESLVAHAVDRYGGGWVRASMHLVFAGRRFTAHAKTLVRVLVRMLYEH